MKTSALLKSLVAMLTLAVAGAASAQAFPSKPINMIVAFNAGGPSDFIARTLGKEMSINLQAQ